MLTAEEHALLSDLGDKLLALYDERDEANAEGDLDRLHQLQVEIDDTKAQRQKITRSVSTL